MKSYRSADWRPTADLERLRRKAVFLRKIREFFQNRGILEVDTPLISHVTATDPYLDSFRLAGGNHRYLLTSPEHAMKRLVAAGAGPVFQITKAFREGESGTRHNPEFLMLEWYRPEMDLFELQEEVINLLSWLGVDKTPVVMSFRQAFLEYTGLDPFQKEDIRLQQLARKVSGMAVECLDHDTVLDVLMTHCVEPELGAAPVFITDYPASQAALAKVSRDQHDQLVAKRFELYIKGIEIANAYDELICPEEQRRRFVADNEKRRALDKPEIPLDEDLLAALPHMPSCSGIALGLDRLFMVLENVRSIRDVIAFPENSV